MLRRDFLVTAGRQAAALALGALFARRVGGDSTVIERYSAWDDPFKLGVASGMPGPDSVVLWTRLAPRPREPLGGLPDAPVPVRWELAEDEHFSKGFRTGETLARPEHAHSVHVEVEGLASDRRWFYRFHAGAATSPLGRTRTAPAADAPAGRLRLALASCQHYEQGEFAVHREIAERDLDLVLFVGDYIYESSNPRLLVRAHEALRPLDLAAYRQRHVTYKLDANLRACHAAHPWLLTWDDHEVENDYAGLAPADVKASAEDFASTRAAAYKAYFEHLPVSPKLLGDARSPRIHAQHRWGRLAELWTLDGRQYKNPQACNAPGRAGGRVLGACAELDDAGRTMLGAEQEAWIAAQLAASERPWRLIGQGTQIARGGIETPLGRSIFSDGWDGYPHARQRLLAAIAASAARGGNVVCLGGDVHRHVVAALRAEADDERTPIVAAELVTTSVTSRGLSENTAALLRRQNADLLHARGDERGYVAIELTPQRLQADLRATAFPVVADAKLHSQAKYVVEAGQPKPQRD
ncbi:MAG TPA: alkaline phosphatase D family protein [Methylibium sp.]|uniref:alkaline phosphatase D family protein n=1 Tax=Methylibium sp. TaxID=2067992 RepID=UPI002DBE7445|nr:alkaline phosphatase D family protein [Methylibium sp.]HEU4460544.1 alkaline phosphatase D family protein [Methylibium sp.]